MGKTFRARRNKWDDDYDDYDNPRKVNKFKKLRENRQRKIEEEFDDERSESE
jgi:hypothetical protein|tara:strand:- start:1186 stop:1341 length:156 start_codon:yes stop_codon:yes gene_type:complete